VGQFNCLVLIEDTNFILVADSIIGYVAILHDWLSLITSVLHRLGSGRCGLPQLAQAAWCYASSSSGRLVLRLFGRGVWCSLDLIIPPKYVVITIIYYRNNCLEPVTKGYSSDRIGGL
jgi:hypothetical protein